MWMRVLIVESDPGIGWLWKRHLERCGAAVSLAQNQDEAVSRLAEEPFAVLIVDLILADGSAAAVADYASYRQPDAKVIFVTNSTFFSDGSIFQHFANACAFLPLGTRPEDLAAVVEHHGGGFPPAA
jgi:DNA-binding NtrC family response regulator